MTKIVEIVKECIEKHVGGNKYFDEMDNFIKYDKEILQEILNLVSGTDRTFILSGAFGWQMVDVMNDSERHYDYILLNGSPRKMENVEIADIKIYGTRSKQGIFLDDTFFSGGTFFYCKGFVESKFDIKVNQAVVAYDGSKHKQPYLKSLYRYYDYHDVNGRPLF